MIAQSPVRKPVRLFVLSSRLMIFIGEISWTSSVLYERRKWISYVWEENSWNTASCVYFLLVAFGSIISTTQASFMTCNRVLMRFNTAIAAMSKSS
jgi:hypothetical protein